MTVLAKARWVGLGFAAIVIHLTIFHAAAVPKPVKKEAASEKEIYAEAQAWQYTGVDLAKGQIATITAKGEWKINPQWKQKVGAGGNPKTKANSNYVKPGAREGCLLIRTGDGVLAFVKDDEVIVIKTPGKIYCCANDEPTEDGLARFRKQTQGNRGTDYVGAIPIEPGMNASGNSGFLDNSGSIRVRVETSER